MPRKSARQLQKSSHAFMLRKGNSKRLESIRSQPSLSHSCQYLRTLTYCHDCLYQDLLHFYDPNDMTDLLVGEEFDNLKAHSVCLHILILLNQSRQLLSTAAVAIRYLN